MLDRNKCLTCKYSAFHNELTCDYILWEGHRRGCYEGKCTKYEERTTTRKYRPVWKGEFDEFD